MLLDAFQTTKNDLKKTALRLRSLKKKKNIYLEKRSLLHSLIPNNAQIPDSNPDIIQNHDGFHHIASRPLQRPLLMYVTVANFLMTTRLLDGCVILVL